MKSLSLAIAALFSLILPAAAAPRVVLSTPSLSPESEIDLVLDSPAVPSSQVGQTIPNTWLDIQPPLPGKIRWKSPVIAGFLPDHPPSISTSYTFSIPQNLRHLDGSPVPAGKITDLATENFRMMRSIIPDRWESDYEISTGTWLLIFNDTIDPAAVAGFISFTTSVKTSVAAVIDRPTYDDLGYMAREITPWNARATAASTTSQPDPKATVPNAIRIRPITALPPAKEWKISILSGLPNTSAQARTSQDTFIEIGEIKPFLPKSIDAITETDSPRRIEVQFTHLLPKELPADFLEKFVRISPRPDPLTATIDDRNLILTGNLSSEDPYSVTILPGWTSRNGTLLANTTTKSIKFKHLTPQVALPSDNVGQLAEGNRQYRIYTRNLQNAHVRVKKLSGTDLVRAFQGYRHVSGIGPNQTTVRPTAPLPIPLILGKNLLDKDFPLENAVDTSHVITLNWDDLLPKKIRHGVMFLEATGTANPLAEKPCSPIVQSIVQLTDIGLAWKTQKQAAIIHAFSCQTGKPLVGLKLQLFGEDAAPMQSATTDANGLATLPRSPDNRQLLASLGNDQFITDFDNSPATVGLWHFPVRYSWNGTPDSLRRLFWFTDRSLYRPGETVRIKGILRDQAGNVITPPKTSPARLAITDPTSKEIFSTPVTFSENGSFDASFTFPTGKTGTHTLQLLFPEEIKTAEAIPESGNRWAERERILEQARFELPVRVEHFRRNAFELTQSIQPPAPAAPRLDVSLKAAYYQGAPVAAGTVKHYTRITPQNPYPERFRDFLFGNHRSYDWGYWYHYFGYDDDDATRSSPASPLFGETTLDAKGDTHLSIDLPKSDFPSGRSIDLRSEVTDANNQTLTARSQTTVHPAELYIGVSRVDQLTRVGETIPLKIVAATPDGEPYPTAVSLTATLTREVNTAVRTQSSSGATTTQNDAKEETVLTTGFTLDPAASKGTGMAFPITPKSNGLHFLTLRGTDPQGRPFATVTRFYIYGTDEFPWQYEDGLRVKLVSEKKSYKPGETARVLVLSPIEGTALVTIEREKVLRSFLTPIQSSNPVIEIPLTADDAPNAYVSVLIIKGSADSARKFKEPQLRLGYCELKITNERDTLHIALPPETDSRRPGESVTLTGKVTLANGNPAPATEVTLYAEDEGTLAVMGYETPKPMDFFYDPRNLGVETGISFENFISEDPDMQSFNTKGFFVGGGGDLSKLTDLLRKNFDPCATWAPSLITAPDGSFSHSFTLPDTLTRYRIIAVAHNGPRFGHAESALTAKKDLMLEVKTPRFANQSDSLIPQVLVQNTSSYAGSWNIQCQPQPPPGSTAPTCRLTGQPIKKLTLAAGASATLTFPMNVEATGEAILHWSATPVSLDNQTLDATLTHRLSDAVESRFPCLYPVPLLRENRSFQLPASPTATDLLAQIPPARLDGQGEVTLEFSHSPLVEASASVNYLLHYPYGCAEQTTSSLIPWCAVAPLRPFIPSLASVPPQEVRRALQGGADRLLSMQLADGSFSYWPGDTKTVDWATSYASIGLVLAADAGAFVPDSALNLLREALIRNLRGIAETPSAAAMENHARALLALSLAKSPQASYLNAMADRLPLLTPTARHLLAAATALSAPGNPVQAAAARAILTSKIPFPPASAHWMPRAPEPAYQLLAWTSIDPTAPETHLALDRMLHDRNPYGHWNTTWANGWSLLAISRYAPSLPSPTAPIHISLQTHSAPESITLTPENPTATRNFPLSQGLKLLAATPNGAFVRLNLASKPAIAPVQPVAHNGLSIDRIHDLILPDCSSQPLADPNPGDLIRVTLRVTLPTDDSRYLVIDDPLPAIFETVDPSFASQAAAAPNTDDENDWHISHSELRDDRAVFFLDHAPRRGTYNVTYLVRCTLPGQTIAPPAKVESMYNPGNFALSASRIFTAKPTQQTSAPAH